jgi:uncharacterized protein (TIGR00255 family)
MTGFAAFEGELGGVKVSIEIKGYNSRYLDIYLALPEECAQFEFDIRRLIAQSCRRGKIELGLRVFEKDSIPLKLNKAALKTYVKLAAEAAGEAGIESKLCVCDLLRFEGVLEAGSRLDFSKYRPEFETLVLNTLAVFTKEREKEGKRTEAHIISLLSQIEEAKSRIAVYAPLVEERIKTNIEKRFLELKIEGADENRILAETAFLLMKFTIAEELSRLESHFDEFRSEVAANETSGKKLDFLCQEIGREVNTIASKTPVYEVSRFIVPMKEAIENIREQLRNIE